MAARRVLSVGQCGVDSGAIAHRLRKDFDAEVVAADTHGEALQALRAGGPFDLVLVNRVGDSDGAPGLELIRKVKAEPALAAVPIMLVSDYPDAQKQAAELGAVPGFGKSQLSRPAAHERLAPLLGDTAGS
jgi:CheY-like chemotaxis protein